MTGISLRLLRRSLTGARVSEKTHHDATALGWFIVLKEIAQLTAKANAVVIFWTGAKHAG